MKNTAIIQIAHSLTSIVLLQMWPAKHCKGIQSWQLLQNHP